MLARGCFSWLWMILGAAHLVSTAALAQGPCLERRLATPLKERGTVSFVLRNTRPFANGDGAKREKLPFLTIPGLAQGAISQGSASVAIEWKCDGGPNFQGQLPGIPGPEQWYVQVTWDAPAGIFDFYLNGVAATTPGVRFAPWKVDAAANRYQTWSGPLTVENLQSDAAFLSPAKAVEATPLRYRGRHAELFGQGPMARPLDVEPRLGRLLLDVPLAANNDTAGWVMEGPGKTAFQDGWMKMWSTRPEAAAGENGHIVYWCPQDFPPSFVCEWECQILSPKGLNIVFFAAKGENGEDLFSGHLPQRDGTFSQYTNGKIVAYHISYYANTPDTPGRSTANLRKDHGFYLLTTGPVAIPADSQQVHRLRIVKDGRHIQALVDGRVFIDYIDGESKRYGEPYTDGKIGLRQMQWTVARYRQLKVWELLPAR